MAAYSSIPIDGLMEMLSFYICLLFLFLVQSKLTIYMFVAPYSKLIWAVSQTEECSPIKSCFVSVGSAHILKS